VIQHAPNAPAGNACAITGRLYWLKCTCTDPEKKEWKWKTQQRIAETGLMIERDNGNWKFGGMDPSSQHEAGRDPRAPTE
jgi:hypothetical protein